MAQVIWRVLIRGVLYVLTLEVPALGAFNTFAAESSFSALLNFA